MRLSLWQHREDKVPSGAQSVYILVLCQTWSHKLTQYGEHGLVAVPYSPSELRVRHRELSCTQGNITNITHSLRYLNTELHTETVHSHKVQEKSNEHGNSRAAAVHRDCLIFHGESHTSTSTRTRVFMKTGTFVLKISPPTCKRQKQVKRCQEHGK